MLTMFTSPSPKPSIESKPFLLRFKFRDFVGIPSEPGDYVYSDKVHDRRGGNAWQLQLYPGGAGATSSYDDGRGGGVVSVFLHNVEGPDVDASTSFILRDARGGAFHRVSSDDVDRYVALKECFGYFSFVGRSTILDEASGVLLGGTLVIDVEVRTPRRST
jgi:hypothetical protein